jgi:hypothetical protein
MTRDHPEGRVKARLLHDISNYPAGMQNPKLHLSPFLSEYASQYWQHLCDGVGETVDKRDAPRPLPDRTHGFY